MCRSSRRARRPEPAAPPRFREFRPPAPHSAPLRRYCAGRRRRPPCGTYPRPSRARRRAPGQTARHRRGQAAVSSFVMTAFVTPIRSRFWRRISARAATNSWPTAALPLQSRRQLAGLASRRGAEVRHPHTGAHIKQGGGGGCARLLRIEHARVVPGVPPRAEVRRRRKGRGAKFGRLCVKVRMLREPFRRAAQRVDRYAAGRRGVA